MRRHSEGLAIGVDIGGTCVKLGLVRGRRVLRQFSFETKKVPGKEKLIGAVSAGVRELLRGVPGPLRGVGVGIPGLVLYPEGVVRSCVNLPGWRNVPLRGILSKELRLPIRVDNDVNVMALAEWRLGAGRGAENLVCLTLGTGVGGAIIAEGRLVRGWLGSAGEIGHMPIAERGPRCSCGGTACLERTVGNREILRWVKGRLRAGVKSRMIGLIGGDLRQLTPEVIDRACEQSDPLARAAWSRVGSSVGLALVSVVNLLAPERIVVGGGIAKAGRWLFEPMRKTVKDRVMKGLKGVKVVPALLGTSAGLVGAALLLQEED
ncbi:MAG: ROK family protein [Candidatus Omnitrophica bacterium]|nr:ROK family protein [Candidatus Omnitrophota bacterium]